MVGTHWKPSEEQELMRLVEEHGKKGYRKNSITENSWEEIAHNMKTGMYKINTDTMTPSRNEQAAGNFLTPLFLIQRSKLGSM